MKDLAKYHKKCRLAALSALIIATHQDVDKEVDGEFYTIPQLVEDVHRYADAMVAYAKEHPFQEKKDPEQIDSEYQAILGKRLVEIKERQSGSHAQVAFLDSEGAPYGSKSNWGQES